MVAARHGLFVGVRGVQRRHHGLLELGAGEAFAARGAALSCHCSDSVTPRFLQ